MDDESEFADPLDVAMAGPPQGDRLTLEEYRELLATCERPTQEQIEEFIEFVRGAHSWYKHLPLFPPGKEFTFFLDPHAGREVVVDGQGSWAIRDRIEGLSKPFHYTWMTTAEYRRRFGWLSYAAKAGPGFIVPAGPGQCTPLNDRSTSVCDGDGRFRRLPQDILGVATVPLTGVIHPSTSTTRWAPRWMDYLQDEGRLWPSESGGEAAAREIEKLCREITQDMWPEYPHIHLDRSMATTREERDERRARRRRHDARLEAALKPERDRQKGLMRRAISEMLDVAMH